MEYVTLFYTTVHLSRIVRAAGREAPPYNDVPNI